MTLDSLLEETSQALGSARASLEFDPTLQESGELRSVGRGVATVTGLPHAKSEELVRFPGNVLGLVFNLDPDELGVILLGDHEHLDAGMRVERTHRVVDTPVGEGLLGRIVDAAGRPLDNRGAVSTGERRQVELEAPPIMDRAPVTTPLQTGIKAIDALIPIGRGQRELILGDRQTGKTVIAIDTIINQRDTGVICVYCAVGQRDPAVARVVEDLRRHDAMAHTVLVVASCEDPPGVQFIAPYAATTIGEYFMEKGRDVLVVFDDLTKHARSYRELSLLLRRPPGREAYPGDIFYIHSRLLERSTRLRDDDGGGSITALPVIETQAQNISAYIPTNLISITDGQIYLSPGLFRKGHLPAIDVGKSVSRVGGKAQLPAYRAVAGDLRLSYSQFEELERFSRFGTRLDDETRATLEHGYRVREVLKQPQYRPIPVPEQIAVLLAASEGVFDNVDVSQVGSLSENLRRRVREEHGRIAGRIEDGEELSEKDNEALVKSAREVVESGAGKSDEHSRRSGGHSAEGGGSERTGGE